jgi:hypothetical protein
MRAYRHAYNFILGGNISLLNYKAIFGDMIAAVKGPLQEMHAPHYAFAICPPTH